MQILCHSPMINFNASAICLYALAPSMYKAPCHSLLVYGFDHRVHVQEKNQRYKKLRWSGPCNRQKILFPLMETRTIYYACLQRSNFISNYIRICCIMRCIMYIISMGCKLSDIIHTEKYWFMRVF